MKQLGFAPPPHWRLCGALRALASSVTSERLKRNYGWEPEPDAKPRLEVRWAQTSNHTSFAGAKRDLNRHLRLELVSKVFILELGNVLLEEKRLVHPASYQPGLGTETGAPGGSLALEGKNDCFGRLYRQTLRGLSLERSRVLPFPC